MDETTPGCVAEEDGLTARGRRRAGGRAPAAARALTVTYPRRRESAAEMRSSLRAYLAARGVDPGVTGQVVLATDEAFVNALTHARDDHGIRVSARVSRDRIVVEVRDSGRGFTLRRSGRRPVPGIGRTHGRGIFLMHCMMDEVVLRPRGDGTTVRMVRRLGC